MRRLRRECAGEDARHASPGRYFRMALLGSFEAPFNAGHRVGVANPGRIKRTGASEGIRAKTGQVDACLIARFRKRMEPQSWQPEPWEIRKLKALGRRRGVLTAMRTQENDRSGGNTASVEQSIGSMSVSIDKEIKAP